MLDFDFTLDELTVFMNTMIIKYHYWQVSRGNIIVYRLKSLTKIDYLIISHMMMNQNLSLMKRY